VGYPKTFGEKEKAWLVLTVIFEASYLLLLGFVVGLSGALIPGPLLVYTISQSIKEGRWTGLKVIIGHAFVELFILALLYLGVSRLLTSNLFVDTVSILGGLFLFYMAYHLVKTPIHFSETSTSKYGSVVGGVFFTAFNPSFPLWWATVGSRLLIEGFKKAGSVGAILVVSGHWVADFGWYLVVSFAVAYGSKKILTENWLTILRNILALFLLIIGGYFLYSGVV
jgi:threonine/homoserine/homoserine lactone efflux protein